MIGKTLGHYRVGEQLGRGGKGEVYVADDTALDRKVALKFLTGEFTGDPERMARFEREAKLHRRLAARIASTPSRFASRRAICFCRAPRPELSSLVAALQISTQKQRRMDANVFMSRILLPSSCNAESF
jgi:serine/threonine protein kinase